MHSDRSFPPLIDQSVFLVGPTASGKSAVSLHLAERLDAELLSLDSIAVYRGMDIGTAKPSPADRARVPHHLLDLADPWEEFSVSRYLEAAHQAVAEIRQRGKTPIFVGGTPLYLKGLLRGFYVGPPADWEFRASVQRDLDTYGVEALYRRLQQTDPLSAYRLHPSDVRRITRALEVAYLTGIPLSHRQIQFEQSRRADQCRVFALTMPRERLNERIDRRVEWMFAAGLVDEVRSLLAADQPLSRTASQAVGYREVLEMLGSGGTQEQTQPLVQLHTRQMAKRQMTWLRSLEEVRFVEVEQGRGAEELAAEIATAEYNP